MEEDPHLMSGTFADCVAVVTGGSRGIGRATALQLAREGADVAISYGSQIGPADAVVAEIEAIGRKAIRVQCDVSKQDQIDELVGKTRETWGPSDHLAHCGAISNTANHADLTYDLWFETIDVNLNGAFRIVFAVKDEMIERERGSIVLISSVAALRPRAAAPCPG